MNTQQPKALYLASELRAGKWAPNILQNESGLRDRAADELERLHNENEALCAALAAVAQPVAWPKDVAEAREFMDAHCQREERANDDSSPSDDDLYVLTAHDFLSAVCWWTGLGENQPPAQAQGARQPLTDDQIERLAEENGSDIDGFARAIEAAHGIHP